MGDSLKKVQTGDKLRIPAAAYNAFIDAAHDLQDRQRNQGRTPQAAYRTSGIVLVKNASGADQDRFAVLGVDAPIYTPEDNLDSFKNKVALSCVVPVANIHEGKFVVLAEPIPSEGIGRAYAAGVCPVKIDVPDEDHQWHYAEIANGVTTNLKVDFRGRGRGAAGILWRAPGSGVVWAVVRLGQPIPMHVFPVELTQYGGQQGDEENPATWTYDVREVETGQTLESGVDPVAAPHKWQRPSVGQMIAATFGYAHYQDNGSGGLELVLGWINEMVDQEACPASGSGGA